MWDEDDPSHAEDGNKMAGHDSLQMEADNLLVPGRVSYIQAMVFLHASVWEQTAISLASYRNCYDLLRWEHSNLSNLPHFLATSSMLISGIEAGRGLGVIIIFLIFI